MTSLLTMACGLLVISGIPSGHAVAQSMPLAPFSSVEVRNGVHAILRYGPIQRVTFLKGSSDDIEVTVTSDNELVIDKCKNKCARGYELEVEIVVPELARITLAQGGWLQSRGTFPRQAEIDVTLDNGGTIDIRSMSVGTVTASVVSGGRILVMPLTAMRASVVQGGNITYWGDARVTQSIRHGGVITRGSASDFDKPLLESSAAIAPVPAIPALPPSRTYRSRGL